MTLTAGCTTFVDGGGPQLQQLSPLPTKDICRVAVLPFLNESNYTQADLIVYKIFMAEFNTSTTFQVSQEGDVRKAFRQLQIYPQQKPSFDQLRILADRLGAQLLITGTVNEAGEVTAGGMPNSHLVLTLQIIDAQSGRTLWNTYHKRDGQEYQKVMHFGLVATISGLARRMCREIIAAWLEGGLKACGG